MTLKHRVAKLEQQYGRHDETFELMGMILTGPEFQRLIESGYFKTTQDMIDPSDRAP